MNTMIKFSTTKLFIFTLIGFLFVLASCTEDDSNSNRGGTVIKFNTDNFTNDSLAIIVSDINNKNLEAPITIEFAEGEYILDQAFGFLGIDGVYIKGAGRELTTLNFGFNVGNGFPIVGGSNVVLCDFTAKNTTTSIFEIRNVNKLRFTNIGAIWDTQSASSGPYGIYPTASTNVVIENCYAKNAIDAGIYSGQNVNVIIKNNVSEYNVFGIEVENSINTLVTGNTFRNNSTGGLIYDLANLTVIKNGSNTLIENNIIKDNNRDNFAALIGNGGFVGTAPVGVGLVLAAYDNVEVRNNVFSGNELLGIAQVTYFIVDPTYNPLAEGNTNFTAFNSGTKIHNNTFTFGVNPPNLNSINSLDAGASGGSLLIAATYLTAGLTPFAQPVEYIIESQDYSGLDTAFSLPEGSTDLVIGERPYLGQSGEKVIEANYLNAKPDGSGIIITPDLLLSDFAKNRKGFSAFGMSLPNTCM